MEYTRGTLLSTLQTAIPQGDVWPELSRHEYVVLQDARGNRIEGTIDGMTNDRSTLWIQLKGGLGRQLIHHLDGYWLETPAA